MSSIIVLDSSDEEDEAPAKKYLAAQSMPATITPIRTTTNTNAAKQSKALRNIPGGITITARRSPVTATAGNVNNASTQQQRSVLTKSSLNPLAANVNVAKPQLPILPKISAAFKLSNCERRTPTPPKQQLQQQQQLPPLQPSPSMRKRKTPTPPQRNLNTAPAVAIVNTTGASEVPPLLPLITSVHSMAESATPPLQLLATPPHTASSNFSDQLLPNPHLIQTRLPVALSITAETIVNHQQNNNNNNGNSYKIKLPKRGGGNSNATSLPVLKTSPPPLAPPTLPSHTSNSNVLLQGSKAATSEKPLRRIKPTTLLNQSDEAWLQRERPPPVIPLNDDVMEELPFTSASNSPKPTTAKKSMSKTRTVKAQSTSLMAAGATTVMDLTKSPEKRADLSLIVVEDTHNSTKEDSSCCSPNTPTSKLNGDSSSNAMSEAAPEANTRPPLEPDFEELIKACRMADASPDMERLIEAKLNKYYYGVHPDFVKSRGFRKNLRAVTERIRVEPELVYYNVKTIVDELRARRKCNAVVVNNEEASTSNSTGNKHTDEQIKKLNKALYIITKRIEMLDQAEVDWDDDVSTYVQVERYKKRACQIYEKICDLTGESKNALRLVKKPIQFTGTSIPQFNKTLQAYINRTKEFPDYYDVLRMLEHCNRQYELALANFEMKRIAHDAFIKVGKLLQSRRKTDLYETVTHFTANTKDPAATDPTLLAKLSENQKHQTKISTIIEKYAREQDQTSEEQKEARLQEKLKASASVDAGEQAQPSTSNGTATIKNEAEEAVVLNEAIDDEDDDDDEDEDELEDEEDEADDINTLVAVVENLTNGGELSDAESDVEITAGTLAADAELKLTNSREEESEKDKAGSSTKETAVGETAAETSKILGKPQATKISILDDPKTCDITEHSTATQDSSCISTSASASNSVYRTVNNNVMRNKTVEAAAQAHSAAMSNGTPSEPTATSTTAAAATTITVVDAAMPTLKIMSVTSLNESVSLKSESTSNTKDVTATSTMALATTTTTSCASANSNATNSGQRPPRQAIAKQRTLAEIVISDEES